MTPVTWSQGGAQTPIPVSNLPPMPSDTRPLGRPRGRISPILRV